MKNRIEEISPGEWFFICPGCGIGHSFNTLPDQSNGIGGKMPVWSFNGDLVHPTFQPSLLVRGTNRLTDTEIEILTTGGHITPRPLVCHSFVTDGNIQFLGDCTHPLAGKTVPLEDIDA